MADRQTIPLISRQNLFGNPDKASPRLSPDVARLAFLAPVDAVGWAVEEGIADPDHVAIMGGSYGGYAVLAGLTFTPDTFASGVDLVGPSNLITMVESVPS